MDAIQSAPHRPEENSRCKAITKLIEAVAEQQEALARILEAEHKKIEKVTQLYGTSVDDMEDIDESVERDSRRCNKTGTGDSAEAGPVQRMSLPGFALHGLPYSLHEITPTWNRGFAPVPQLSKVFKILKGSFRSAYRND